MKTTLGEILKHGPCGQYEDACCGWGLLTKNLGTSEIESSVSLKQILDSNGIHDAIWALRCFDYKEYCLFLADIAESVLPIYQKLNSENKAVELCIKAIRLYKAGKIGKDKLKAAAYAADSVDSVAAYAAAYAADAAADAADSADSVDSVAAYAVAAAAYAAYAVAAAADSDSVADAARKNKWIEITDLFKKHFCDEKEQQ